MEDESVFKYLKAQGLYKKSTSGLDSRVAQLEKLEKLSTDLIRLEKAEKEMITKRTKLRLEDLETRVKRVEEKDLQRLIEMNHTAEMHGIMLQQTDLIFELKNEISEVAFNISNDDRIQSIFSELQEKMYSMCENLEKINRSLEKISTVPLNQEVQYLHREITEDNIRKEQENVRIELIQEQIDQLWKRCDNYSAYDQEANLEQ